MRLHLPRCAAALVCILALFWFIPDIYSRATRPDKFSLGGSFSPTLKQFMIMEIGADRINFRDEQGNVYANKEAQRNLPFLYTYNMRKWGGFPLTLDGRTFTFDEVHSNNQHINLQPRAVLAPKLPLHILFESSPEGALLELPSDMLRLESQGFSFIRCADGTIDAEKSSTFTEAALQAGLTFPVLAAGGNPSPLKSFDEGLLLVDANNKLFQLKMVQGKPLCRDTGSIIPDEPIHVGIEESERREFFGPIVTRNAVYLAMYDGRLQALPLEEFSADRTTLSIRFGLLYHSVLKRSMNERGRVSRYEYLAVDEAYNPVHVHSEVLPEAIRTREELVDKGRSFLTPFSLHQYMPYSPSVKFLLQPATDTLFACLGIATMLLIQLALCRHRKTWDIWSFLLIAVTGLPGFIAVRLFGPIGRR